MLSTITEYSCERIFSQVPSTASTLIDAPSIDSIYSGFNLVCVQGDSQWIWVSWFPYASVGDVGSSTQPPYKDPSHALGTI